MNTNGKRLAVWGTILQSGLLISVGGIVFGMLRAFCWVTVHVDSSSTAKVLAESMAITLYAEVIGFAIALVGIVLLLIALMGRQHRSKWFRKVMWTFCILWPLTTPLLIGIIFSIVVMIYLCKHKEEFTEPNPSCDVANRTAT
jgi:hypothetical protein